MPGVAANWLRSADPDSRPSGRGLASFHRICTPSRRSPSVRRGAGIGFVPPFSRHEADRPNPPPVAGIGFVPPFSQSGGVAIGVASGVVESSVAVRADAVVASGWGQADPDERCGRAAGRRIGALRMGGGQGVARCGNASIEAVGARQRACPFGPKSSCQPRVSSQTSIFSNSYQKSSKYVQTVLHATTAAQLGLRLHST